jgi:predicted MFS family arabinose efflux permease
MAQANTATDEPVAVSSPWSPLRVALFRSLWLAGLASNLGTFMHTVAAGWAVTELSTSPTVVSLVQAAWTVPGFLMALLAGALADVLDRRRLIVVTQVASMVTAAALGVADLVGALNVPLLLLLTFLLSTAGTIAAPAFMAVTPELVERSELPKAIGLNSISMNVAQSAGPALAGLVIALAGPGAVFVVNAASFLGIVIVVRRYRPDRDRALPAEHLGAAIRTGVRYFRNSPRLQVLTARVVLAMTVSSSLTALLPIVARTRLEVSAGQFGLLSTATGLGAVGAVWLLPRVNRLASPDAVVGGASVLWACGAALVGSTTSLPIALVGLAVAGAGAMATMNIVFSMYTVLLPSWVRGRASSVAMLVIWLGASAGAVGWGALASSIGLSRALVAAAITHVAVTAAATLALRIGPNVTVDITPVSVAIPELQIAPSPEDGPVLVTIEWRIDPSLAHEFAQAMVPVRRQRRRDGGYGWRLYHDLESPGRLLETFTVSTWAEHERQHHRAIAHDDVEQQAARAFLVDGGPVVHHLIAERVTPRHHAPPSSAQPVSAGTAPPPAAPDDGAGRR